MSTEGATTRRAEWSTSTKILRQFSWP